jgi:hypothetical protein
MTDSGRRETPPDPFAIWRQAYEQAEKGWTQALEQVTGTDAFSQNLGQSLDSYLSFQKLMRDSMQTYLETMNLPTRNDIARLGELIVNLEGKIDDLDDRVDMLLDEVGALRRSGGERGRDDSAPARRSAAGRGRRAPAAASRASGAANARSSDRAAGAVDKGAADAGKAATGGEE